MVNTVIKNQLLYEVLSCPTPIRDHYDANATRRHGAPGHILERVIIIELKKPVTTGFPVRFLPPRLLMIRLTAVNFESPVDLFQ